MDERLKRFLILLVALVPVTYINFVLNPNSWKWKQPMADIHVNDKKAENFNDTVVISKIEMQGTYTKSGLVYLRITAFDKKQNRINFLTRDMAFNTGDTIRVIQSELVAESVSNKIRRATIIQVDDFFSRLIRIFLIVGIIIGSIIFIFAPQRLSQNQNKIF